MGERGGIGVARRRALFRPVSAEVYGYGSRPNVVKNETTRRSPVVSSQQRQIPPLEVRERATCMCDHGDACSSFAPGHALHLIQSRLAAATPSDWSDAIVEHADPASGVILVRALADGAPVALWSGAGAAHVLVAGAPVSVHGRYHVLAVGRERFNVVVR
jgi:hypothetical protein